VKNPIIVNNIVEKRQIHHKYYPKYFIGILKFLISLYFLIEKTFTSVFNVPATGTLHF